MVLTGSRRFSAVLVDSQWYSVVLPVSSRRFSRVLVGHQWVLVVLVASQWFSVVLTVLVGSQWFSYFLSGSKLFS